MKQLLNEIFVPSLICGLEILKIKLLFHDLQSCAHSLADSNGNFIHYRDCGGSSVPSKGEYTAGEGEPGNIDD